MKRYAFLPLALLLCAGLPALTGCNSVTPDALSYSDVKELTKTDIRVGQGEVATAGRRVSVHFTGWLYDDTVLPSHYGQKFDSTLTRGKPYEFVLGTGQVIKGWDIGLEGMKVGGQRTLIVPSALAYGPKGYGKVIPPNTALVFYVELEAVH
jgi:FKBP-type peptidyl-prolyl cis-trans isomerase FkpA